MSTPYHLAPAALALVAADPGLLDSRTLADMLLPFDEPIGAQPGETRERRWERLQEWQRAKRAHPKRTAAKVSRLMSRLQQRGECETRGTVEIVPCSLDAVRALGGAGYLESIRWSPAVVADHVWASMMDNEEGEDDPQHGAQSPADSMQAKILDALASGPMTRAELVVAATGKARASGWFGRALAHLADEIVAVSLPRGWWLTPQGARLVGVKESAA